jgi:hypothetical protein
VAFRSDKASIVGAFLSQGRNIHIGSITLAGVLNNLLKVISEGHYSIINDIIYE